MVQRQERLQFHPCTDTHGDIFLHKNAVVLDNTANTRSSVAEGKSVQFDIVGDLNRQEATNVIRLDDETGQ